MKLNFIKIAKQIYAAGQYLPIVTKYLHEIYNTIKKRLKDGNLIHNMCIRIKIDKHDIKNEENKDFNYIIIEMSSPQITNKQIEIIGIRCSSSFRFNMQFPQIDDGVSYYDENMIPEIHMGVKAEDFQNYWNINAEDTLEHQLIHIFEGFFGYKNKNLNYNRENQDNYDDAFNIEDEYDWKVKDYFSDHGEYTPYLTNLISALKKIYNKTMNKNKVINLIKNTDFNDKQSVRKLSKIFEDYDIYSDSCIIWLYHLCRNNTELFNITKKKIINRILKF